MMLHPTPARSVWSIREAAAVLGICEAHVRRLIQRGDLRAVQLGRRKLIPVAAIEELLAGTVAGS